MAEFKADHADSVTLVDSWDSDNKGDDKVACQVKYQLAYLTGPAYTTPETRVFRKKMDDPEVARSGHPKNDETPWDAWFMGAFHIIQHKEILSIGMYWDVLGMASFPASSPLFPRCVNLGVSRVVAMHPRYSFLWNFAKKELFLIEARWKKTGLMRCPVTTKPISPSLQSPGLPSEPDPRLKLVVNQQLSSRSGAFVESLTGQTAG